MVGFGADVGVHLVDATAPVDEGQRRLGMVSTVAQLGSGLERAHERPVIAQHAAALVPDPVGLDEVRVVAEQCAVLLVRCEAREAEQCDARSLAPSDGRK